MFRSLCWAKNCLQCLVGNGTGDSLTNPPCGIGAELEPFAVVKLFHSLNQDLDVALLETEDGDVSLSVLGEELPPDDLEDEVIDLDLSVPEGLICSGESSVLLRLSMISS